MCISFNNYNYQKPVIVFFFSKSAFILGFSNYLAFVDAHKSIEFFHCGPQGIHVVKSVKRFVSIYFALPGCAFKHLLHHWHGWTGPSVAVCNGGRHYVYPGICWLHWSSEREHHSAQICKSKTLLNLPDMQCMLRSIQKENWIEWNQIKH